MDKTSPLTTAYNMFVYYKGTCVHYAIIIPPNVYNQCCRLKLAKAFGWENPEGVSSWEFILPDILDKDVKVRLMEHRAGAKFSPTAMFYTSQSKYTPLDEHIFGREEFLEDVSKDNSPEQVKLVKNHLDRYAMYLGGYEVESRYDSTRWEKHLTELKRD